MKKILSIFLLSILLFNLVGYRLLSSYMEGRANEVLMASLDNNQYNDADLISIKLASHLPYYTSSSHFSRIDGEIQLNGVHYNYVKSRVYNDSVEYLCIPNRVTTKLSNARDEFYKVVNDLQHPSQNKKNANAASAKQLLPEYYQDGNTWTFAALKPERSITTSFYLFTISTPPLLPREVPPDGC